MKKTDVRENKKTIGFLKRIVLAAAAIVLVAVIVLVIVKGNQYTPIDYPVYGFANMRGENGVVYRGIGGAYGEDIAVEASTFAVRGDKMYYAGQIKEDYVVSEERTGTICEANLDGTDEKVLVEDAYNLGFGQEKLIGDKIFYPNGFDEDYNTTYAWYDVETGETGIIESSRINNIFGYDGTCVIYGGFDAKKSRNIVGKYNLEKHKDKTLFAYGEAGEVGDVISLYYYKGLVYAVTLVEEMQDYDARTAVYQMISYSAQNGKKVQDMPLTFTGSANYGFLYDEGEVYFSTAEAICHATIPQGEEESLEITKLAGLSEREYWGIPHFVPGDGFLYYETIADIDEDTGMNDYFYRVPLKGGSPELLAAWFTS